MPWSEAQNKLFRAAEHNPAIAKSAGIPQATAKKLAHEGVTTSKPKHIRLAETLSKMNRG